MDTLIAEILASLLVIILGCMAIEISMIRKFLCATADELVQDDEEPAPTISEMERHKRDEDFRTRILKLKEELAQQSPVAQLSSDADVLHPMVYNLPHNMVSMARGEAPGEFEVAE